MWLKQIFSFLLYSSKPSFFSFCAMAIVWVFCLHFLFPEIQIITKVKILNCQLCLVIPLHKALVRVLFPVTVMFGEGFMGLGRYSCQSILVGRWNNKIYQNVYFFYFLLIVMHKYNRNLTSTVYLKNFKKTYKNLQNLDTRPLSVLD